MNIRNYCHLFLAICIFSIELSAQALPEIVVTSGHHLSITALDFHPNGDWVATGSQDASIRIWSKKMQREHHVLYGHLGSVSRLRYSNDGKYLISSDAKGFVYVWDLENNHTIIKKYRMARYSDVFEYLPNSNYFACFDSDSLFLHALNSDEKRFILKDNFFSEITASPSSGKYIGYHNMATKQAYLIDWRKPEKPAYTFPLEGYQKLMRINHQDNQVASLDITKKVIHLFSFGNLAAANTTIPIPDSVVFHIFDMDFSPSGATLAVLAMSGRLYLYDTKTCKLLKVSNLKASYSPAMTYSKSDSLLLVSAWGARKMGDSKRHVLTADASFFNPITEDNLGFLSGYPKVLSHLSVDSAEQYVQVFHSADKFLGLRTWNLREGELDRYTESFNAAGASINGQLVAIIEPADGKNIDSDSVHCTVYRLPDYKKMLTVTASTVRNIAVSSDGKYLVFETATIDLKNPVNNRFHLHFWDINTKKRTLLVPIELRQASMMSTGFFRIDPQSRYLLSQAPDSLYTRDLSTGAVVSRILTQWMSDDKTYKNTVLDFCPTANHILIGNSKILQFNYVDMKSEMIFDEWDYTKGSLSKSHATGIAGFFGSGDFDVTGNYLVTGHADYFGVDGFPVMVWDWNTKKMLCQLDGHHGQVRGVWFGHKGNRVYSISDDGFLKIWNINECKLQASFLAMEQSDYLLLSPDNYYKTSKNNHDAIGFRYQGRLYGFDQFDLYYNRPDKVLAGLGVSKFALQLYAKAWEKRVDRLGYDKDALDKMLIPKDLPRVSILNQKEIPLGTQAPSIVLNIAASDSLNTLSRLHISVNDVPIYSAKGYEFKDKNRYQEAHTVNLMEGKNIVKVSVVNGFGMESFRETVEINKLPSTSQTSKPDLYIFSVAVADFKDSSRNLRYTEADAQSLVAALGNSKQFANVHTTILANEQATKENILKQIEFLKKARTNDAVLVFFSSHGVLDDKLDYYLATHDTDFGNPAERALAYQDIDKLLLDKLECRNRLVLLDACHSGEIDKDDVAMLQRMKTPEGDVSFGIKSGADYLRPKAGVKDAFNYMQQLFTDVAHNTGSTVIAAAGGFEFAIESTAYSGGHGVFTHAVLEAFKDLNADTNRDKAVSVSELHRFVANKVVELTGGKQRPTTRQENGLNDFILFK